MLQILFSLLCLFTKNDFKSWVLSNMLHKSISEEFRFFQYNLAPNYFDDFLDEEIDKSSFSDFSSDSNQSKNASF